MRRFAAAALLTCLPALPSWAEPATPQGAAAIAEALGRYLPPVPGTLSVAPAGDSYSATLVLGTYFHAISQPGFHGDASALTARLTDLGDGRWQVVYDQPFSLNVSVPGVLELDVKIADLHSDGVFDTALMAYEQVEMTVSHMTLNEVVTDPAGTVTTLSYALEDVTYQSQSVVAAAGAGVDTRMHYSAGRLVEVMKTESQVAPSFDLELTAAGYDMDASATGIRSQPLLELVAWFVAHPSPAAIEGDEAGLKASLQGALPVFDALDGEGTIREISVNTPLGAFGAERMLVGIEMHGAVADGLIGERVTIEGLSLPPGLVPAWAEPLVPGDVAFDFVLSGFDLAAPAALALDSLSFTAPLPELFDLKMMGALLPEKQVSLTLRPGSAQAPAYRLDFEGAMDFGPGRAPVGTAKVSLDGIDAILAALNAGPEEVKGGAVPGLLMARGLGRATGTDGVVWEIEMTPEGKLSVNGNDLSPMLGR